MVEIRCNRALSKKDDKREGEVGDLQLLICPDEIRPGSNAALLQNTMLSDVSGRSPWMARD